MRKVYVLYDERAERDEDEATVLCVSHSLRQAEEDKRDLFPNAVIFEYDDDAKNGKLTNGKRAQP